MDESSNNILHVAHNAHESLVHVNAFLLIDLPNIIVHAPLLPWSLVVHISSSFLAIGVNGSGC